MWPFKKRTEKNRKEIQWAWPGGTAYVSAPFTDDLTDMAVLKRHALRALCGAMTSTHSQCRSPHPFCGAAAAMKQREAINVIALATRQEHEYDGSSLMAIYLVRAESNGDPGTEGALWQLNYAQSLTPVEQVPHRKLVVVPSGVGGYVANYGQIKNPVEGNYYTGRLDQTTARTWFINQPPDGFECDYGVEVLADDDEWPRFWCFMWEGVWYVMTMGLLDGQTVFQHVAQMDVVDDPRHNFGIYQDVPSTIYSVYPFDDSEYAQVIRENCPVV